MLPPMFATSSYQWNDFTLERHRQSAFAALPQTFLMYAVSITLYGPSSVEITYGQKHARRKLMRGDLSIAPYRFSIDGAYLDDCELLQLCLQPSVVTRAGRELGLGDEVELVPVLGVVDPLLEQTIYELEAELSSNHGSYRYVSVIVDTLATHLVRYYAQSVWTRSNVGGFPQYILDRTHDYLDNNRDQDISVREIACVVGIEPNRFARAFRAATGTSVHIYLNARREAARKRG